MIRRTLAALGLVTLLPACGGSPVDRDRGLPHDFDRVSVPAAACSNGWRVTPLPRNGHDAHWAHASDDTWHVTYLADTHLPSATWMPATALRYTHSARPDEAETLEPNSGATAWIATAPDGSPSVFYAAKPTQLALRHRDAGGWQDVSLLANGLTSELASIGQLAIDGAGHHHLFFDTTDAPPVYLSDATGGWASSVVGVGHDAQTWNLLLDPQQHAHAFFVSYNQVGQDEHNRYATDAGGGWQDEPILNEAWGGPSAIDLQGHPHLVYVGLAGMHHVTKLDDGWHDETLPLETTLVPSDLAVDNAGHLHVAISFQANIMYATNASGPWVLSTIASTKQPDSAYVARIALDAHGVPTFAYGLAPCVSQQPGTACATPFQLGTITSCN